VKIWSAGLKMDEAYCYLEDFSPVTKEKSCDGENYLYKEVADKFDLHLEVAFSVINLYH